MLENIFMMEFVYDIHVSVLCICTCIWFAIQYSLDKVGKMIGRINTKFIHGIVDWIAF